MNHKIIPKISFCKKIFDVLNFKCITLLREEPLLLLYTYERAQTCFYTIKIALCERVLHTKKTFFVYRSD